MTDGALIPFEAPPPDHRWVMVSVRIPSQLVAELDAVAGQYAISRSDVLRQLVVRMAAERRGAK